MEAFRQTIIPIDGTPPNGTCECVTPENRFRMVMDIVNPKGEFLRAVKTAFVCVSCQRVVKEILEAEKG